MAKYFLKVFWEYKIKYYFENTFVSSSLIVNFLPRDAMRIKRRKSRRPVSICLSVTLTYHTVYDNKNLYIHAFLQHCFVPPDFCISYGGDMGYYVQSVRESDCRFWWIKSMSVSVKWQSCSLGEQSEISWCAFLLWYGLHWINILL